MGHYISNTKEQQAQMLKESGYESFSDMFSVIPDEVLLKDGLNIPKGISEMEILRKMESISEKNKVYPHIFRGAGAYNHFIPSIVKSVVSKEEFVTAYTPYQAEISQGNLQSIFEFQTMICNLTGMFAANASVYDGATAAAESLFMCVDKRRTKVLVSETVSPEILGTIKTYCYGRNVEVEVVPMKDGETDKEKLSEMADKTTACFLMQQPNYFGIVENAKELGETIHETGGKFVMSCNPISLAIMETPFESGADIAVGEAQPLGMPLSFGGPYLGFMSARKEVFRKLPGRIVGETVDTEGRRGFVLTLQAREQHIRREKASSNICSNQALCALTASVYLSSMGTSGLTEVFESCAYGAHYLQKELEKIGLSLTYKKEFFHEFLTDCPVPVEKILTKLHENGYLGGLPVGDNQLLWCVTEMNTKEEIDTMVELIKEAVL